MLIQPIKNPAAESKYVLDVAKMAKATPEDVVTSLVSSNEITPWQGDEVLAEIASMQGQQHNQIDRTLHL
jgi:hypothetical protein